MEVIRLCDYSFCYPNSRTKALDGINLIINQGDFITLFGKSGCGKTTFLRSLKPVLCPHGAKEGRILFKGRDIEELSHREQSEKIGFVLQSPDAQLVTDKVWHELAFGLESLGLKSDEIRARVAEVASFFGIGDWYHKNISELSGGQKQLVNLASVMAMGPEVLILDEPTAQLDPIAAGDFLMLLTKINKELGTTIILCEHRLEEALPISSTAIVMDSGKIMAECAPKKVCRFLSETNDDLFFALPVATRVCASVDDKEKLPLSVGEGRKWLANFENLDKLVENQRKKEEKFCKEKCKIEVKDVCFAYEKISPQVLSGLSCKIFEGEHFCILGGNGAGKSTLLSVIGGFLKPQRGKVILNASVGFLPQNPEAVFVGKTVAEDMAYALQYAELSEEEKQDKIHRMAELYGLKNVMDRHPYDLSGGERQRAALAKIMLTEPEVLLLDEPTKGLDALLKEDFAELLKMLKNSGVTVITVSHDVEFCARYADRCALMFDGRLVSQAQPREFFANKSFYTTAAGRMARGIIDGALLAEDIITACRGTIRKMEKKTVSSQTKGQGRSIEKREEPREKSSPWLWLVVLLIPLTIYLGHKFWGDGRYYFISLLVVLEIMVPFAISFEQKKHRAREWVIISVLCAIAVGARSVFYMLPQIKPALAIVIISGVALGGEGGFIVGALCAFVSNFFFGQGPWTPWQMFAMGLIGFLAGAVFHKKAIGRKPILLCVFGLLSAVVIYGGIMNPVSLITYQGNVTRKMLLFSYVSGFAFDLVHGVTTALVLLFAAKPMLEKIDRIKTKYGI